MTASTIPNLAQAFWPVNHNESVNLYGPPNSMIHHKVSWSKREKMIVSYSGYEGKAYGVSKARRVLSPQFLLKRIDNISDCLENVLGLTLAQREVTIRLLRFWAYYGSVYPKEAQVSHEPGCSKATYWRTIRRLTELGLVMVINRYVIRPHSQISNLYRLDRLILLLARYLSEHGVYFREKWLTPALAMPGRQFWDQIWQSPGDRAGPGVAAF